MQNSEHICVNMYIHCIYMLRTKIYIQIRVCTMYIGSMPFFSKLFFQANFSKKLWKKLEKIGKIGKTFSNFGAYLRRNTFARVRYIRRYPSFIFTRAIADLTTGPAIMMTSLYKYSGPVCRPDCLLQPSPGQGAACAGG